MTIFAKDVSMVRLAREHAGLSMKELADRLPLRNGKKRSISYVSRLERGGSVRLTGDIAQVIAALLDIPPDEEIFVSK